MLNNQEIEDYKKQLEERRADLMAKIESESQPTDFGGDTTSDNEEEADEAEEFSNQLAIAQTFRNEVQEIDSALSKIQNGTYGICDKCGAEISKEVLDVAPESTICESCKQALA